jgi:CRP-like cAMP-binding protein
MVAELSKYDFQSGEILDSLDSTDYKKVLDCTSPLVFERGQRLFYEGGVSTGVFIIQRGKAKIFKSIEGGRQQIFYIYKPGELVGYHALLGEERYEDSCEAIEHCETLFINSEKFIRLLDDIPKLRKALIKNMSHEFGVLVNTIALLAQKSLRVRLALYLLLLDVRFNSGSADTTGISLRREDLANLVGTAL